MADDLEIIILSSDDESTKASMKVPSQKQRKAKPVCNKPITISGNIVHQVKLLCSQSQPQNASQIRTGNSANQQCVSSQNKRITLEIPAKKCQNIIQNKQHNTSISSHPKSVTGYSEHYTRQTESSKLGSINNLQNQKSLVQSVNKNATNTSVAPQFSSKATSQNRIIPTSFANVKSRSSIHLNGKSQVSKNDTSVSTSVLNSLQKNGISVSSLQKNGIIVMNVADDDSKDCSIIASQQSRKASHTPHILTKCSSINNSNMKKAPESKIIRNEDNNIIKSNSLCQAKRKNSFSGGTPSKVLCVKKSSIASESISRVLKNNTLSKQLHVVKPIERTQNFSNVHNSSNAISQRQMSNIPTQSKLIYPHKTHSQNNFNIHSQNNYKTQAQNIQKVQSKSKTNCHSLSTNYQQPQNHNSTPKNQTQSQYKIQFQENSKAQNHSREKFQKSPEFILPDKIPPKSSPSIINFTTASVAKKSLTSTQINSSQNRSLKENVIKNISQSCSQLKSLSSSLVKKNDAKENHSRSSKNNVIANSNTTPFFNPSLSVTVINSDKKTQHSENISKPIAISHLIEKRTSLVKNSKDLTSISAAQPSNPVCKKIDLANDRETLLSVLALCEPNSNKQVQPEKSRENNIVVLKKSTVGNKQVKTEKPKENDVNDFKKSDMSSSIILETKELKQGSSIEPLVILLDCENEPFIPLPEEEIDIFVKKSIKLKDVSNLMKNWSKPVVLLDRINLDEKYFKVEVSASKVECKNSIQSIRKPAKKFPNKSKSAQRSAKSNLHSKYKASSHKNSSQKAITIKSSKYCDVNEDACKLPDEKSASDTVKDVTLRSSISSKDSNDLTINNGNVQTSELLNASSTNDFFKINNLLENPNKALKANNELTYDAISSATEDINNGIKSKMLAENQIDKLLGDLNNKQSRFCKMKLEDNLVVPLTDSPQSFLPKEKKEYISEKNFKTEILIPKYEFDMENSFDISESLSVKNLLECIKLKAEKLSQNKYYESPNELNDVSFPCIKDCVVLLDKKIVSDESKKEFTMPCEHSLDLLVSKSPSENLITKETLSLHSNCKLASIDEISKKISSVDNTLEINLLQNNSKHTLPDENIEINNNKCLNAGSLLLNSFNEESEKINNISEDVTLPKENITIPLFNLSLLEIDNNSSDSVIHNCLSQILREVDSLCAKTNTEPLNANFDKSKLISKFADEANISCSENMCQSASALTDAEKQLDRNKDDIHFLSPLSGGNKSPSECEKQTEDLLSESVNQSACAINVTEMQHTYCSKDDILLTSLCNENKHSSKLTDQTGTAISKTMSVSKCVGANTESQHTLSDFNKVSESIHFSENDKDTVSLACNLSPSIQREVSLNENLCEEKDLRNQLVKNSVNISETSTNIFKSLFLGKDVKNGKNQLFLDDQDISGDVHHLPVPDKNLSLFCQEKDHLTIGENEQETIMLDEVLRDQVNPVLKKDPFSSPVKQDTKKVIEVIPLPHVPLKEAFSSPVRKQNTEKSIEVTSPKLSLKRNRAELSPNTEDNPQKHDNSENSSKKIKLEQSTVPDSVLPNEEQVSEFKKSEMRNRNKFMELLEFSKMIMEREEKTSEAEKNKIIQRMKQQLNSTQCNYVSGEEFASLLLESLRRMREDPNLVYNLLNDIRIKLKNHKFKSKAVIKANSSTNIDCKTSVSISNTVVTDDSQSIDSVSSLQSFIPKVNETFLNHVPDKVEEHSESSATTNSKSVSPLNNVISKKFLNNEDENIHLISSDNSSSAFENKFGSSEIATKLGLIPTGSMPPKSSNSKSNIGGINISLDPVTSHQESKFSCLNHDQVDKNEDMSLASSGFYNGLKSESSKNFGFKQEKKETKDLSPVASTSGYHSSTSENSKPSGVNEDCVKHKLASTSEYHSSASENSKPTEDTVESVIQNPRNAERIKKLEKALAKLDKEIKKCQKRELSLNDLESEDSVYIKENLYKKRFIKVYNKICELTNSPCRTGRIVEKRFNYEGSRYKAINEAIQKLVNKKKAHEKFPDYSEVYKVVKQVNDRLDMGLSERDIDKESERVFKDVGIVLQERRCRDDAELLGCYLTDDLKPEEDPAERDEELRKTLDENNKKFEKSISELIDKYAEKQKANQEEGNSDKGSQEEEEDDDEEKEEEDDDEEKEEEGKDEEDPDDEDEKIMNTNIADDLPSTNPNSPVISDGIPADLIQNDISDDDIIILDYSDKSTDPNDDAEKETLEKTVITDSIVIEDSNDSDDLPSIEEIMGR